MEALALHGDVRAHQLGGLVGVAAGDGLDDAAVLGLRGGHAVADAQLQAAEWREAAGQRQGLLGQEAVAPGRVDGVMKALVLAIVGVGVAGPDSLLAGRERAPELCLEELAKSLTAPKGRSFWFMLEPLLMSKAIFDSLPADQQKAILEVGAEVEAFGQAEAMKDDDKVREVYAARGAQVVTLGDPRR